MPEITLAGLEQAMRDMLAAFSPSDSFALGGTYDETADGKRRGFLVINPESPAIPECFHGNLVERDGKEYRIVVDKLLVGARDKEGKLVHGYWIEPDIQIDLPTLIDLADRDGR